MTIPISYTKYPGEQNTYNGGNFFSNDKVATAGCSGTTCNVLAANSVFSNGQGAPLASNQSGGRLYYPNKGGKSKKRRYSRKMKGGRLDAATRSGGASKKRRHSRKMKGGRLDAFLDGGASKKRRHSRKMKGGYLKHGWFRGPVTFSVKSELKGGASKRRSHKRRHSRKMKGGRAQMLYRNEGLLQRYINPNVKGGASKKKRYSRKMKGGALKPHLVSGPHRKILLSNLRYSLINGHKGGKSKKRRHSRKMKGGRQDKFRSPNEVFQQAGSPITLDGGASKKRSHKRRHSRKMKGGARQEANFVDILGHFSIFKHHKGGKSKRRSHKKRHSKKKRSHKKRYSRKLKGGMRHPLIHPESTQIGGGTQLMNNICHSSGYSIGPVGTELKPTEVGLAALHYAPYTNTQNNNFSNII